MKMLKEAKNPSEANFTNFNQINNWIKLAFILLRIL